jgi:signal peptidase I
MLRLITSRVALIFWTVFFLLIVRVFIEARYLPGIGMVPNLRRGDRIVLQKLPDLLHMPLKRGTIIFFYPPPMETGGQDLSYDPPHILGRLTGLPFFPADPVFVKRVIGLPGDQIRIENGVGVYVNGQLLSEPYVSEAAAYNLARESDIGGRSSAGALITPYPESQRAITVPEGKLFLLGDNRNASEDSHVWGYVSRDRTVGRLWFVFSPKFEWADAPDWMRSNHATRSGEADGAHADQTTSH